MSGDARTTVLVVGSINIDICVRVAEIPRPGETVAGQDGVISLGGKGANQAVAAARLGAAVSLVGCLGDDAFGQTARGFLECESIDLLLVRTQAHSATGLALITLDARGQNAITVSPAANSAVSSDDIDRAFAAQPKARFLLLQNEIPAQAAIHAARRMKSYQGMVIVDPAPAAGFSTGLLVLADILTPNESEAEALSGIAVHDASSAMRAAQALLSQGAGAVIVKRGAAGVVYAGRFGESSVDAPEVTVVDTVAAGDCFNGALAVALSEGRDFRQAIQFACRAAALSVTRAGASSSMPHRRDLG